MKDVRKMTNSIRHVVITAGVWVCLGAATSTGGQSSPVAESTTHTTLGLAGFANATPSLAAQGRTVAVVWTASKDAVTDVYLSMSNDGGATFSEPRRVNDQPGDASANNEQPPRVVLTVSGSNRSVNIFWSKRVEGAQRTRRDVIRMARSIDGGRTFSAARTTHDPTLSGARGWESLATGPDGVVHAVWLDGRDAEKKMADAAAHTGMAHNGQPPQDAYHATVAEDGRISESRIASGVCFCCKTAVAVDSRGAVYAAWRHIFPGSMRDIAFAKSADGRQFEPLVRVSEDKWELNGCPEDGPSIAVDQSGVIHIVWATLISDGESQKALFYATSRDGKTFSPRARIQTAGVTNPGHPQLALTPQGGPAIIWDETVDGARRISLTQASRNGSFRALQSLSGNEPGSHPVIIHSAASGLLVAWTGRPSTGRSPSEGSMIRLRRLNLMR
jgi:hypothetical protein